jgi:hypothetical protein
MCDIPTMGGCMPLSDENIGQMCLLLGILVQGLCNEGYYRFAMARTVWMEAELIHTRGCRKAYQDG